jgi:hypothetical protein
VTRQEAKDFLKSAMNLVEAADSSMDFSISISSRQIKPEPKLRPWRPEEVPIGALLKGIPDHDKADYMAVVMITGIFGAWITYNSLSDIKSISAYEALDAGLLHSVDGGKTWARCGFLEATK